jgi:hypothetical protein
MYAPPHPEYKNFREKTLSIIKFLACFLISATFSLGLILLCGIFMFPTSEKMERFRYVIDNPEWHDQDGQPPIFVGGDIVRKFV